MVSFYRVQQPGVAPHLVERYRMTAAGQHLRISPSGVADNQVIKREKTAIARSQFLSECALTRLPCPSHHNRRHNGKPFSKAPGVETW